MSYNNRGGNYNQPPQPKLPDDYLKGGYYSDSDKKCLREEYIVKYPKDIANNLRDRDKNKAAQLRKYYDFVIRIKDMINNQNQQFKNVLPELKRLDTYVAYAFKRTKITKLFADFINQNLAAITDEKDFRAFAKHFEAVIAYLDNK